MATYSVHRGYEQYYEQRRPKKITVFCNGDRYFPGKVITISPHRYISFNDLLNDISSKFHNYRLPYGVRQLFTPSHGHKLHKIDELKDGNYYVCGGFEMFKSQPYGTTSLQPWRASKIQNTDIFGRVDAVPSRSDDTPKFIHQGFHPNRHGVRHPFHSRFKAAESNIPHPDISAVGVQKSKPRLITVVRFDDVSKNQTTAVKILLNRQGVRSFEHLLSDVSEAFGPKFYNDAVKTLYSSKGKPIASLAEFFRGDQVFIASSSDSLSRKEVETFIYHYNDVQSNSPSIPDEVKKKKSKKKSTDKENELPTMHRISVITKESKKDSGFGDLDASAETDGAILTEFKSKKRKLEPVGVKNDLVWRLEQQRAKAALEERERAKKRLAKKIEAEQKALEEAREKRIGLDITTLKPVNESLKQLERRKKRHNKVLVPTANNEFHVISSQKPALPQIGHSEETDAKSNKSNQNESEINVLPKIEEHRPKPKELLPPIVIPTDPSDPLEKADSVHDHVQVNVPDFGASEKSPRREDTEPHEKPVITKASTKTSEVKAPSNRSRTHTAVSNAPVKTASTSNEEPERTEKEPSVKQSVEPETGMRDKISSQNDQDKDLRPVPPTETSVHENRPVAKSVEKPVLPAAAVTASNKSVKEPKQVGQVAKKDALRKGPPAGMAKPKFLREVTGADKIYDMYEPGRVMGDGNFAIVRACKKVSNQRDYAIKIIDKAKLKGKDHMVESEIRILKMCDHPNIVKLFEEYETKSEIFLIMELVKGGDLFDAITQSVKFDEPTTAGMVQDMCKALFYLHSRSIVHRDMKPENLLVYRRRDGTITLKLGDFGLAMEVKESIYTVCGTPTYVAPEILSETGYGLEVDLWATGVITYILLCGFPPFRSPDRRQSELFSYIKTGRYDFISPYWDRIGDSAKDLIKRLLIVDRRRRYTAIDVLCHPWVLTHAGVVQLPDIDKYRKHMRADLIKQSKENMESFLQFKSRIGGTLLTPR